MTWDMGHPAGREPGALIRDLGHSVGREPGPLLRAKRGLITKATVYPATGGVFSASEDRNNKNKYPRIKMQNFGGTVWRTLERTTKTSGKS